MKNRVKKMVILTGMLCAMSLAVYGCGRENTPGSAGVGTGRENNKIPVPTPMEGTDDKDEKPKPTDDRDEKPKPIDDRDEKPKPTDDRDEKPKPTDDRDEKPKPTDDRDEKPKATSAEKQSGGKGKHLDTSKIKDGEALTGEIVKTGEMQFTAREFKTEKAKGGGDVVISPGSGVEDSEYRKISVTYDHATTFFARKIWDGGAKFEDFEASSKDLGKGTRVSVWGSFEGTTLRAHIVMILK